MTAATVAALDGIADTLNAIADLIPFSIEVVTSDHAGKRPRRSHRIITQRVYQRTPRAVIYRPTVVKVIKVKE